MTPRLAVKTGPAHARILGVGGYRPERVVPNSELVDAIDSSDEWIRQRSGIQTRHFAAPEETVTDMAEKAARDACAMAGIEPGQIDAIVGGTVSHPYQTPGMAPQLADRMGMGRPAAFDISAACAGYCYGVSIADSLVRSGAAENVLVLGVEKLSDFVDFTDRGTAFIFGDGAGAAIIGPSDTPAIGPTVWGSDGEHWDKIQQRASWMEVRKSWEEDGTYTGWPAFAMQGQAVFRWAVWEMAKVAKQALDAAGITADDLDVFIPHQANMRITDQMIKELRIPDSVTVARDIVETGNTSAASVPLAAARMLASGEAKSGDLALQFGFGAGLVYAAQVVELP